MELHEIVKKLVGEINPVGASHIDSQRFENLKTLISLVDALLNDIDYVSTFQGRQEASLKKAGLFADDFLNDISNVR
jgi:hypothetical protein